MQTFFLYNPVNGAYEALGEHLWQCLSYARIGTYEIDPRPSDGECYTYNPDNDEWEPFTWPEPTPDEARASMPNLTARQLRLGLLELGKLDGVPVAIEALPEPERSQAQIEWDYAGEFRRLHPLIVQLIPILGITDEEVDPVWVRYASV